MVLKGQRQDERDSCDTLKAQCKCARCIMCRWVTELDLASGGTFPLSLSVATSLSRALRQLICARSRAQVYYNSRQDQRLVRRSRAGFFKAKRRRKRGGY